MVLSFALIADAQVTGRRGNWLFCLGPPVSTTLVERCDKGEDVPFRRLVTGVGLIITVSRGRYELMSAADRPSRSRTNTMELSFLGTPMVHPLLYPERILKVCRITCGLPGLGNLNAASSQNSWKTAFTVGPTGSPANIVPGTGEGATGGFDRKPWRYYGMKRNGKRRLQVSGSRRDLMLRLTELI